MRVAMFERCADLNRLDATAQQADQQVASAVSKLGDARRSQDEQAIREAQQAVLAAKLAAKDAHRTATQQGSGAQGDRPAPGAKAPSERGAIIDTYA